MEIKKCDEEGKKRRGVELTAKRGSLYGNLKRSLKSNRAAKESKCSPTEKIGGSK
jgi:hypothetical protein